MQRWVKSGLLFDFSQHSNTYQYASLPNGFWLSKHVMRIIFSTRNTLNQSVPFYIDYDFSSKQIVTKPTAILLPLGNLGTFDDSGIMPSCLLQHGNELWMYYIGWNLGVTVPFRNSIGLACSNDNGLTFKKMFEGPIVDRTKHEPHFVASSCVVYHEGIYKMWYLSCTKWEKREGTITHFYHIKYATSANGIDWNRDGTVAIDFKYSNEYAISVPRVIIEDGVYKMWYSYRGGIISDKYRIGYAESADGVIWNRKDENVSLSVSDNEWDSDMLCYPFVFEYEQQLHLLYNGNNYGKTGFGLAILEK